MKSRGLLFDHRRWHLPILVLHTLLLSTVAFVPSHRLCVLSPYSSSNSNSNSNKNKNNNNNVVHDTNSVRLYFAEQRQQRRTNNDDDDDLPLYDVATQLLNLVLNKRDDEITTSSYEKNQQPEQSNHMIENLIERLTRPTIDIIEERKQERKGHAVNRNKKQSSSSSSSSSVTTPPTYDPNESLFDCGFFCTLYWYYPNTEEAPPIWAKLSLLPSNIKGQQYYVSTNLQQSVINYSEIYGTNIHIKAEATLSSLSSKTNSSSSSTSGNNDNFSLSSSSVAVQNSRTLRTLPDIFRVDATKIILSVFGVTWNFSIKGSANLVVLYADPRLRIFVSPRESRSVVGNWESAGLVVVQVRSDLVAMTTTNINPDQANNRSKIIDLR